MQSYPTGFMQYFLRVMWFLFVDFPKNPVFTNPDRR